MSTTLALSILSELSLTPCEHVLIFNLIEKSNATDEGALYISPDNYKAAVNLSGFSIQQASRMLMGMAYDETVSGYMLSAFGYGVWALSGMPINFNREKNDQPKKKHQQSGYVYVLQGDGTGFFKIGITTDIDRRTAQISPKMPFESSLVLYAYVDDMRSTELYLHEKFNDNRVNGEWFELSASQIRDIDIYLGSISDERMTTLEYNDECPF